MAYERRRHISRSRNSPVGTIALLALLPTRNIAFTVARSSLDEIAVRIFIDAVRAGTLRSHDETAAHPAIFLSSYRGDTAADFPTGAINARSK